MKSEVGGHREPRCEVGGQGALRAEAVPLPTTPDVRQQILFLSLSLEF